MLNRKKFTQRKILRVTLTVIVGMVVLGFLPDLLGKELKAYLQEILGGNYLPILSGVLIISVITLIIAYLYEDLESEKEKEISQANRRKKLLGNLKEFYQNRLEDKMQKELRFEINLNLQYTIEGTSQETIDDSFIITQETQAGDFDKLFETYINKIRRLLILGEPGAGKSILLLRFGLKLIELAEKDINYPIPVILDLASWKEEDQTFEQWLERILPYMGGSFGVSNDEAKELVETNAMLPLLDGFDEIREQYRNTCFEKLYPYLQKVRNSRKETFPEVIICSRIKDYLTANDAPVFASVKIQPLQPENIQATLQPLIDKNDNSARRLQRALVENPDLYAAISSAFFVNILLSIYSLTSHPNFSGETKEELQEEITDAYIQTELEKLTDYPIDKVKKWLGWLAWKMKHTTNVNTFELTDIQPQWTNNKYRFNFVRILFSSLLGGLTFGLIITLFFWDEDILHNDTFFLNSFIAIGLLFGCLGGCFAVGFSKNTIATKEILKFGFRKNQIKNSWRTLITYSHYGIIIGMISYFPFSYAIGKSHANTMIGVMVYGLFAGLLFGLLRGLHMLFYAKESFPIIDKVYKRLFAQLDINLSQWTYYFGATSGVISFAFNRTYDSFWIGAFVGIMFGVLQSIFTSSIFKHFCLRITLFLEKVIPFKLVTFLDSVSENSGLLTKNGGQWRFRHQLIHASLAKGFKEDYPRHYLYKKLNPDKDEDKEKETFQANRRTELLENLKEFYQNRLEDKMQKELRFEINLNLQYTIEGTSQETIDDSFIITQETQAGDFDKLFETYINKIRRLLILGEPGAGKSILLLRFGLKLIELAEKDINYPIPVILDLASWKEEDQTFEQWLERILPYMGGSFGVSNDEAKELVETNAMLPLLDGFDEIREQYRNTCFEKLYPYLQKVRNSRKETFPEVIICSRIKDYLTANDAPVFASVKIQPLQPENIQATLQPLIDKNDNSARRLQRALVENPDLYAAISSAFFVNILLSIYSLTSHPNFSGETKEELQEEITDAYIQTELEKLTDYPIDKVKKWLGWLAWKMKYTTSVITFELTDLQPQWANKKYRFNFPLGLTFGLLFLILSLFVGSIESVLFSLCVGLFIGLVGSEGNKTITVTVDEAKKFSIRDVRLKILWRIFFSNMNRALIIIPVFFLISALDSNVDIFFDNIINICQFMLFISLLNTLHESLFITEPYPKTENVYKKLIPQFWKRIFLKCLIGGLACGLVVYNYTEILFSFITSFTLLFLFILLVLIVESPFSKHLSLRLTLFLMRVIPIKLVVFLDSVSKNSSLLTRNGRQWHFRHQLIHASLANWFEEHCVDYSIKSKKQRSLPFL